MSRTRLQRVRAAVGIASLVLQQTAGDLGADDINRQELAAILRELQEDVDVPSGLFPALAPLVSTAASKAEQIEPGRDGDASPSEEPAKLILSRFPYS